MLEKFNKKYNEIIMEATLEKMSKIDQAAVNSGDKTRIKSRISFYERALEGKENQPNGKPYKKDTCTMYIKFLQGKLNALDNEEKPKGDEKEETKETPEINNKKPEQPEQSDKDAVDTININVTVE